MKLLLAVACVIGCGGSSSNQIASTPLEGSVGGKSWTFVAGSTDPFLSQGQTDFFAVFYPVTYVACGAEPSGDHLIVSVPMTTGTFDMNLSRNMTFVVGTDNLIATEGAIRVDSVTSTQVTGGLHGTYDGANEVDGTFTLTVCAPMP